MARSTIDFGIDLGTTNSAISVLKGVKPEVVKNNLDMDITSSAVYIGKQGKVLVGMRAKDKLIDDRTAEDAYVEFKRRMGGDSMYTFKTAGVTKSPEELSAEILKSLKGNVQQRMDEDVKAAVITIPAAFAQRQCMATKKAAELAGFTQCPLLQEPVAASLAYGFQADMAKKSFWLVFDFGGGTFDADLVNIEKGIMKVFDTEGDNYLGGKNLDENVVNEILLPYLQKEYNLEFPKEYQFNNLKMLLKQSAEEIRIALSSEDSYFYDTFDRDKNFGCDAEGNEIGISLEITKEEMEKVLTPLYQRAIDICKQLLQRNNLTGEKLSRVILVGGPTHSPLIRRMLREQITPIVDTSIDPMTVVATGAALYASTIDNKAEVKIEVGTVKLNLEYEATSVGTTEWVTVKLASKEMDKVYVELTRGDKAWSSGRREINAIGDVLDVYLVEGKSNAFIISAYDQQGNSLPCFPNEITIIQGTKVPDAPLAYNVGMEVWDADKQMGVFRHFDGLEKNKPLPATGKIDKLKTTSALRPGNANDFIQIPIYEAEYDSDGERATLFNHTYTLLITGEIVPQLIPEGSDVELTLKCADSGWELSVYFPGIDYTEELKVPKDTKQDVTEEYLRNEILKGQSTIAKLRKDGGDVSDAEEALDSVKRELDNGSEKHQVLTHLREALRKVDRCAAEAEWPIKEKKLRAAMRMLEEDNEKYGNSETTRQVEAIRKQVNSVLISKDIPSANELLDAMHNLNFKIARVEYYVAWIADWNNRFDEIKWKDKTRARQLVNQGMAKIIASPTVNTLQPIVNELISLLPPPEVPAGADGLLGSN